MVFSILRSYRNSRPWRPFPLLRPPLDRGDPPFNANFEKALSNIKVFLGVLVFCISIAIRDRGDHFVCCDPHSTVATPPLLRPTPDRGDPPLITTPPPPFRPLRISRPGVFCGAIKYTSNEKIKQVSTPHPTPHFWSLTSPTFSHCSSCIA